MKVKKIPTDYDLIESFQDEHNPFAREAFIKFYENHSSFIYNSCYSFVMDTPQMHDVKAEAKDLSQIVINKIIKGSLSFKPKTNIPTNEIVFHVRSWIYRIIENTFNDECIKKASRRPYLIRFEDETQDAIEHKYIIGKNEEPRKLSKENQERYKLIDLAMRQIKMSDMEAEVLGTYLDSGWFDERDNWNLPPERMSELTDKYKVQRNSIIKCRGRLMTKIKEKL